MYQSITGVMLTFVAVDRKRAEFISNEQINSITRKQTSKHTNNISVYIDKNVPPRLNCVAVAAPHDKTTAKCQHFLGISTKIIKKSRIFLETVEYERKFY